MSNTASSILFGQPLLVPSKQNIIPVLSAKGMIEGFYPIASTTFAGTETSFTLSQGAIPITTVTLPQRVLSTSAANASDRVQQFVAASWPVAQESSKPWMGYAELVPNDKSGYYSWWSMPQVRIINHFSRGIYIGSLVSGMNAFNQTPNPPEPPVIVTPGALEWACSLDPVALNPECAFFDFNWVDLFAAQFPLNQTAQGYQVVPLTITPLTNPAGGFFKASVLTGMGGQTIYPGGGVVFNTIRILKLADPTPGAYTFTFSISANINGVIESVPATLNLTVV